MRWRLVCVWVCSFLHFGSLTSLFPNLTVHIIFINLLPWFYLPPPRLARLWSTSSPTDSLYVSVLTPVLPLPSPRSDQTCALSDQFLYLNLLFRTWLTYCPDDWKSLKCWSVSSSNITEDMYIDKCLFFQGLLWICQTSIYMLAGLFMQCRMKLRWSYFNYILTLHDYQNLQTLGNDWYWFVAAVCHSLLTLCILYVLFKCNFVNFHVNLNLNCVKTADGPDWGFFGLIMSLGQVRRVWCRDDLSCS
jgi:hypothetical protein